MNNIENYNEETFEKIKHIDEEGNEYWSARELGKILEYSEYRKFIPIIKKAMIACETSNQTINNHFVHVDEMVNIGSNAQRKLDNYKLSRYACYLIAQNGDSRKKVIALAQTYFASQTRKIEFINAGYKGLYNGETADDIAKRKGLRYGEDVYPSIEEKAVNFLYLITKIIHL